MPTKVGISIGDPNGIGPEIILKALADKRLLSDLIVVVYGTNQVLNFYKKDIPDYNVKYAKVASAESAKTKQLNVLNIPLDKAFELKPGTPTKESGNFSFVSLEHATNDLANGKIDVLVTAPINKKYIQNENFEFPGHTEYLTSLSNVDASLMLMVMDKLRVGIVTNHIPVSEIKTHLSTEIIQKKLVLLNQALKTDFGIIKPKIAVLGLNPHAGENGMLGDDEIQTIIPAIEQANNNKILAFGPFPADGFFGSRNLFKYDAVLAMYHDQGLIPFKTIAQGRGVNYTAGLPIVRTSPDHGTAYDLVGKNTASAASIRNAILLAIDVQKKRVSEKKLSENPLKIKQKN